MWYKQFLHKQILIFQITLNVSYMKMELLAEYVICHINEPFPID